MATTGQTVRGSGERQHAVLLALACIAQFMVVLDVSIVNVALPTIRGALHFSGNDLQWVVNGYVLTFAGFLMLGGRAADLFGRRRVFMFGLALFTLASLVGGLAENPSWLIAARAVQGVGGAVLSPATLTIITTTFTDGRERMKAIGTWSAVAGAGGAFGALVGGILTSELSWRWILFVNVPVGLIAFCLAAGWLTEQRGAQRARLDVPGAVTVTAGLAALVYAIVGTDSHPWGSARTVGFLAAAAVLLGIFAVIQVRSSSPLVPLGLFRSRAVSASNAAMLLFGSAFFGFWYFSSLWLQGVLHYSVLHAGFAYFPLGVAIVIGARASALLVRRFGAKPVLIVGFAATVVAMAWMSRIGTHSEYWRAFFGPGVLLCLGFGLSLTPLASSATSGVAPQQAGLASGVLNTSRQVGGSLGLAVLATLAASSTSRALRHGHAVASALTSGYREAFVVATVLLAAALVAGVALPGAVPAPATAPTLAD